MFGMADLMDPKKQKALAELVKGGIDKIEETNKVVKENNAILKRMEAVK